jgi:hypothetical protein
MASRRSLKRSLWLLILTIGFAFGATNYTQEEIDSGAALADLSKIAYENAMSRLESSGTSACNKDNVRVYKEW